MIRRLLRFIVAAFCLLSLLAAAGVACLWWESRSGQGYVADASVLNTYVVAELLPDSQIGFVVMRGWPARGTFGVWSQHAYYNEHPFYWARVGLQPWHRFRLSGQSGPAAVFVRTDTHEPVRWNLGAMPPKSVVASSGPISVWTVGNVPPWLVIAALLVPPLLFEWRRWHRLRERRRRVRLGLCLACGYDLRHSPETCPECGAVVPNPAVAG